MATWAKIKFFYGTMLGSTGSTLTAGSTDSSGDYDVDYIYNMLETNLWKAANTASPVYLTLDLGVGNTADADYIAIIGHNLNTIGATVDLEYSATGAWAGEEVSLLSEAPSADTVYLKEFTAPGAKRYWRLKISGTLSAAPYLAICIWGLTTELDYATASFDPYAENVKAAVGLSQGGYVTGIHEKYAERMLSLKFRDADSTLYNKVKGWWDTSGLKNFFVAWETANNPTDVYLMRPGTRFNNPLTNAGAYRDITIKLKGRKE
jgi:hypothetical protein